MGWRPKDLKASLYPMTILLGILAFGTFENPNKRPCALFIIIYNIIILSIFYVLYIFVIINAINDWLVTKGVGKILIPSLIFHIYIAAMGYILAWYHRKTRLRSIARIMKIDKTLEELGASVNYTANMNYAIVVVFAFLLMTSTLFKVFETKQFLATIPSLLNMLIALHFCISIRNIEMRFCKANEVLERAFKPVCEQSLKRYPWRLLPNGAKGESSFVLSEYERLQIIKNRTNTIQIIRHLYRELVDISSDVDHIFGMQVVNILTADCVLLTAFLWSYSTYNIISSYTSTWFLGHGLRILKFIVPMLLINHFAHTVANEAKRTGNLIHSINDVIMNSELAGEIQLFALYHKRHSICFSPAGLFTLGYDFVWSFFGAVLTHLIILVQMGPDVANSEWG